MATPVTSGSIGERHDLPVRLGNTLRPVLVVVRPRGATLAPGGTLHASLFRLESDMSPLASPMFGVTPISSASDGAPRYRLTLSKEDVAKLAAQAADAVSVPAGVTLSVHRTRGTRTAFWTCSYEDAAHARWPLYYGRVVIYLGATGA